MFIEVFQINGIIYKFKIFFNLTVIGYYSLTLRVLQAPLWFVGTSLSQLLYRELSERVNAKNNIYSYLLKAIAYIAFFVVPFPLLIIFFGPDAFSFVFGEEWRESGIYARYLSVWMYFDFIRYIVSQVPIILNQTKVMFRATFGGSLCLVLVTFFGGYYLKDVHLTLILTSSIMSLYAIGIIVWILKIANKIHE